MTRSIRDTARATLPPIEYMSMYEDASDVLTRELATISEAFLSCCTSRGSLDYVEDMLGHIEFLKWAFQRYNHEELCAVLEGKIEYGSHLEVTK
jgi:hypothetical protein